MPIDRNKVGINMNGRKRIYNAVNVFVILLVVIAFLTKYRDIKFIFMRQNVGAIVIITATVCLVHLIKASRLYLALYGADVAVWTYIKIYCKVTPASLVFPFKLGEFFRMYCYGVEIHNLLKGIVTVIFDRFMDTTALVTIILFAWIINGGHITLLTYALMLFLICILVLYFVYPGMYHFWKKYILKAKATEHKLAVLKLLDMSNALYQEIVGVSRGRGVILYFMSLIAWGVEIGSLVLLTGPSVKEPLSEIITQYLISAMGGGASAELNQFVFISVVLMLVIYIGIKLCGLLEKRKVY